MGSFYPRVFGLLLTLCVAFAVSPAIPKPGHKGRAVDKPLSDKTHFEGNGEAVHNSEFDHEAFLGQEEAKKFDDMTPAESKEKLGLIFIQIDRDGDAHLSEAELRSWMIMVRHRNMLSETNKEWVNLNPTNEESVSWEQYEEYTYDDNVEEEDKVSITRDHRRWVLADVDGNTLLSRKEFHDFIHPESTEHLKDLVVKEALEDMDSNHDGVVSLEEYLIDGGSDDEEESDQESWRQEEEEQFRTELDKNGDGVLDSKEITEWLLTDDTRNIHEETLHLFSEADHDKDGLLNSDEVINNYELFVGSQIQVFHQHHQEAAEPHHNCVC